MIQKQYDKMAAFILRKSGEISVGVADVTLPKISYMTDTVSGAGLAGEIETPTMGQLSSMEFGINWRTINKDLLNLAAPNFHSLEFRGAQQVLDSEHEELVIESVRIVVRGLPKETDLGKGQTAAKTDSSTTLECTYLKVDVDDSTIIEIDKLNGICNIGGTYYWEAIRKALGL